MKYLWIYPKSRQLGETSPNQIYPPPLPIEIFGADFENDPGKNFTVGTNYLQFDILIPVYLRLCQAQNRIF